jgi:acyl-CoA thioesterase FadM
MLRGHDRAAAPCVTAEMTLAYRRPVPMDTEVVARARLHGVDGRDFYVEGAIVAADGTVLTSATSRWRQLREIPGNDAEA